MIAADTIAAIRSQIKDSDTNLVVSMVNDQNVVQSVADYLSVKPVNGLADKFIIIQKGTTKAAVNAVISPFVMAARDQQVTTIYKSESEARTDKSLAPIFAIKGLIIKFIHDPWGALRDAWVALKAVTASA